MESIARKHGPRNLVRGIKSGSTHDAVPVENDSRLALFDIAILW
jgi:hypothetical protein